MSNFRVGQKVVCINDVPDPGRRFTDCIPPKRGMVYTVRDYVPSHYGNWTAIRLVEVVRRPDNMGFRASRFRPLVERKTDISIFTAVLNKLEKVT